jgi:3-phenylpropionate/cinnamic acid dioxygenase small subunit
VTDLDQATARQAAITRAQAEDFLNHEAELLDDGRHREWLALFAQDAIYWVPSNELDHDPDKHVSIIYDTVPQLDDRLTRYELGRVVQEIPSRTLHLFGNIKVVDPAPDVAPDLVEIRCGLALYEVHGQRNVTYPAHCRYLLRSEGDEWRIVLKKVAFLGNDQYFQNLAFVF